MKKLVTFLLLASICFIPFSCLERQLSETQSSLTVSSNSIVASAEFFSGSSDCIKTIRIVSNRSWYAHLNDLDFPVDPKIPEFVPWASLSVCNHANLTNVSDTVSIDIKFERNYSESKINGVLDLYSEGKKFLSVPITQNGAVYHLSASADRDTVSCIADTIRVFVNCNTGWSAALTQESTADVSLFAEAGFDPDTILVVFKQNLDALNKKTAEIVLSAKSCKNDTIVITQGKAVPYLTISQSIDTNIFSASDSGYIAFNTNCNWTVSADAASGLKDIVFDKVSGGPSSQEVRVNFKFRNPGDDPSVVNSAKIVISAEGCDNISVNYHHRAPLKMDFYSQKTPPYGLLTDYSAAPYDISVPTSVKTYAVSVTNSKFRSKTDGSHGLQIPQNGSLKFPAIAGMRISAVAVEFRYHSSFKKLRLLLCNEGKTTCYSGVLPSYVISSDWIHVFYSGLTTSPESETTPKPVEIPAGQGCFLLNDKKDMNNLIKTIKIVYEPAE